MKIQFYVKEYNYAAEMHPVIMNLELETLTVGKIF